MITWILRYNTLLFTGPFLRVLPFLNQLLKEVERGIESLLPGISLSKLVTGKDITYAMFIVLEYH
jgi:hypothetical protein